MVSEIVIQKRLLALDAVARDVFGYKDGMKPLQREVTEANIRGHDVLFVVPTSSGKSFCFQGPALVRPGLTLVVSPLIALMRDQVQKLQKWGISAEYLSGDMDVDTQRNILLRLASIDLLYIAPERVKNASFLDALSKCRVSCIAVDECHLLSSWGKEFRSSFGKIGTLRHKFPDAPIIAVTATADEDTEKDIVRITGLKSGYTRIVLPPDRTNLTYHGLEEASISDIAKIIKQKTITGAAVVYVATRAMSEDVAQQLKDDCGVENIAAYHAGLDPILRSSIQDRFLNGDLTTIVATNAFGLGVDKPNIRLVLHYQHPESVSAYAQEAGRAGRDGLPSDCYLNIGRKGTVTRERFIRLGNPELYIYQRLWRILTRGGRQTIGSSVKSTIQFLYNALNMKDHNKSQVDSALAFMEFSRVIEVNPGPVEYKLPVRNSHLVYSFVNRYKCVTMKQNICIVAVTPEEDDPVNEMVRAGAVSYAPPQESKLFKILKSELTITQDDIDRKRLRAEDQHAAVKRFIFAEDKSAYLRNYFLKG